MFCYGMSSRVSVKVEFVLWECNANTFFKSTIMQFSNSILFPYTLLSLAISYFVKKNSGGGSYSLCREGFCKHSSHTHKDSQVKHSWMHKDAFSAWGSNPRRVARRFLLPRGTMSQLSGFFFYY